MSRPYWRRALIACCLSLVLFITGCQTKAPSPYTKVQQETTERNATPAVAKDATQGSQFNRFFPKASGDYDRVYTQEKQGFAEAKLKKADKDVAMLSISDTLSTPAAAAKFQQSTQKLAGFPTIEVGSTQTALLVGDRYQVKVQSRDPSFTQQDRQNWIQKFDLQGLAKLKS
jgi:hypothetical protein